MRDYYHSEVRSFVEPAGESDSRSLVSQDESVVGTEEHHALAAQNLTVQLC